MTEPTPAPDEALLLVGTLDQARVVGALHELGLEAEVPVDPTLIPPARYAAAVVDPDVLGSDPFPALGQAMARIGDTPLVYLSGPCGRERISRMVAARCLMALVARDHVTSDEELRHALRCVTKGPRFGWEHLMAPDAAEESWTIRGSADRDGCLDAVADFCGGAGVRRRIARLVQDVADEFITNAVYDAPMDASGRRPFASLDRREDVTLPADGRPTVRVARDASHVAVSVTDPFGSLALPTVRYYLAKGLRAGPDQVDEKQGGAGLGLTRVYESVDRMTVKVAPGVRTQAMALIEIGGARLDMASRPPALVLAEGPDR
ncbi:MAG: hypothetical protein ACQEXJ_01945 [Myxococcota bacterium]